MEGENMELSTMLSIIPPGIAYDQKNNWLTHRIELTEQSTSKGLDEVLYTVYIGLFSFKLPVELIDKEERVEGHAYLLKVQKSKESQEYERCWAISTDQSIRPYYHDSFTTLVCHSAVYNLYIERLKQYPSSDAYFGDKKIKLPDQEIFDKIFKPLEEELLKMIVQKKAELDRGNK